MMDQEPTNPERDKTIVIAVGMQKGGVGKTTVALHVAAALAEKDRRVLVWDVDENCGATKILGVPKGTAATTMELLTGKCSTGEVIVRPPVGTESGGSSAGRSRSFDFIPSSRALQGLERALRRSRRPENECIKREIVNLKAERAYDYVVIDTGPQASVTTRGAYLAADYFVLSVTPDKQAMASLSDALSDVQNARKPGRNPDLRLLGVVLSSMDRRVKHAKEYECALERLEDEDGRFVKLNPTIGRAAAIDRAYRENRVLLEMEPRHPVSAQFRALAETVESRISDLEERRVRDPHSGRSKRKRAA